MNNVRGNVKRRNGRYLDGRPQVGDERVNETRDETILFIRQGDNNTGYAEVRVSPDRKKAIAHFFPPVASGAFLTAPVFGGKLAEAGITHGLRQDAIDEAIFKANSTHEAVRDVTVAQGTEPVTEIPEHFTLRKEFLDRKPEINPDAARIDWHTLSAFCIVTHKEPLARRIPAVEGKAGTDIYGTEIPFRVEAPTTFTPGANVAELDKGLFASKSGRLSVSGDGEVSVEDVLELKKGVDFTTGNITFPGDVIIRGKVADGFKIYAAGSIVTSEVLDVTEIVCKKDLIAQSGIEGRSKGALRVGGSLSARYIQNCKVAARGDINVSGSMVQSTVYSMSMIRMGEAGKLVGCEVIAIGGVRAFEIGSAHGVKTRVRCGTDFTVQQELDIANEQLKVLAVKIQRAEEVYAEEKLQDIGKHLEELRAKKAEILTRIPLVLPRIDRNDEAFVEVSGTVYPGTEIEICHVGYSVLKPEKAVRFYLDKSKGVVLSEPLAKKD